MTPITNREGMETGEISEIQKLELFQQAIDQLEDRFMMLLIGQDENDRKTMQYFFEENLGMLIEEVCSGNPGTGTAECQTFFEELSRILGNQDLSKLDYQAKDLLRGKFTHSIKIKLSPLIVKKLESSNDMERANIFKKHFVEDQKSFLQEGEGSFMGLPDDIIPSWYTDLATRRQYEQLQRAAASDPKAAKILDDTRAQALKKLRGEE